MTTRELLLDVTVALFAEHGWRGTTTRRIAAAAGLNEVTVFRTFGSKDALLLEAVQSVARAAEAEGLPTEPRDLAPELIAWALRHHDALRRRGSLIRTCLAEFEEHPELAAVATEGADRTAADLGRYLAAARLSGMLGGDGSLEAATTMVMNSLFLDAITRDLFPTCAPHDPAVTISGLIDLTLRGLGCDVTATA
jgi:AcrR family transcriptional regulator